MKTFFGMTAIFAQIFKVLSRIFRGVAPIFDTSKLLGVHLPCIPTSCTTALMNKSIDVD